MEEKCLLLLELKRKTKSFFLSLLKSRNLHIFFWQLLNLNKNLDSQHTDVSWRTLWNTLISSGNLRRLSFGESWTDVFLFSVLMITWSEFTFIPDFQFVFQENKEGFCVFVALEDMFLAFSSLVSKKTTKPIFTSSSTALSLIFVKDMLCFYKITCLAVSCLTVASHFYQIASSTFL